MPLSTQPIANPNGSEPVPLTQEADLYVKVCSLLQTTSDIIYFKDLNSVFTLCSDSHTVSLTGGLDESVIGKSDFDFYDPERAQAFFDDEQEIIRTGEPIIGQVENTARNGKTTWVSSSKFPLRGADGRIIGTYGISRDITEQKRTQQKLSEANAQLVDTSRRAGMAEIATHVIHNVGNVLTSVKVAVSHSSDLCAKFPFEKIERVADLIEKHSADKDFFAEGQRGSHIPNFLRELASSLYAEQTKVQNELLDSKRHLDHISSIVAQQQEHAKAAKVIERVDLSEVIADGVTMSSSSLANHNIQIIRDFSDGMIVETDKHQVLQIIVNLIRNAKHACLESPNFPRRIGISASNTAGNSFCIAISDNGIGISPENIVKLFTYGFTTRQRGKGFGLHSCANVARELGGSIDVQSDGLGKGATFVLTLPGKLK